jgi:hypothetical protein
MRLKHYSLIFSIAGILVLYLLSKLAQLPIIELHELSDYEGKEVTIKGIVTEHYITRYGSQIINIEDQNASATIFVEKKTDVEYGDKVQVTGEVQKYRDEWSVVVNDNRFIKILKKWDNVSFPLWQLAENPSRYLNLNVNVTGFVEFVSNSNFYLVDIEKKHSLIIFYSLARNFTIYPGQKISALGRFSFDEENFRYKLDICDEKHAIYPLDIEQ